MFLGVLGVTIGLLPMGGCTTSERFTDPKTGEVVSSADVAAMTTEEQAALTVELIREIDERVKSGIDKGLTLSQAALESAKPFVPAPYNYLIDALLVGLGGCYGLWQRTKKLQIRTDALKLQDWATAIETGALMTAKSINTIVKPVADVWDKFKAEQSAKSDLVPTTIMPDKITAAKQPVAPPIIS